MELFKEIFINWLLFGVIESYIFLYLVKKLYGIDNMKFLNIVSISLFLAVVSILNIPILKQLCIILFLSNYLKFLNKDIKVIQSIKYVLSYIVFLLLIETVFVVIIDLVFNIKIINQSTLLIFFLLIPVRIIEICILKFYKRK